MGQIAKGLAADNKVIFISAKPNSGLGGIYPAENPAVIEIKNWNPEKSALIKRGIAVCVLAARMFDSILAGTQSKDIVFGVTTPFKILYAAILAAKLRGAKAVLLICDLYPEALEAAGIIKSTSVATRLLRIANIHFDRVP